MDGGWDLPSDPSRQPGDEPAPRVSERAGPSPRARRAASAVITLVVVVAVFAGALPRFADYGEVASALRALGVGQAVLLAALTATFLAGYGLVLAATVPGLRVVQALPLHQAATAVSHTVPSGGAVALGLTYGLLRSFGIGLGAITAGLATAGLWDTLARLGLPVAAAGVIAVTEGETRMVAAALLGLGVVAALVGLCAAALRSERFARRVGERLDRVAAWVMRRLHRPRVDVPAQLTRLRRQVLSIVTGRWGRITALTLLTHVSQYLLLLASLRFLGVQAAAVSTAATLGAYAVVRLATVVPITPGGLGVAELGYVALLSVGVDEPTRALVTAAVLLFRALTYLTPIPLGVAAWLFLRAYRPWRRRSP